MEKIVTLDIKYLNYLHINLDKQLVKWLTEQALKQNSYAQNFIATIYEKGLISSKPDFKKAIKLYTLSATNYKTDSIDKATNLNEKKYQNGNSYA